MLLTLELSPLIMLQFSSHSKETIQQEIDTLVEQRCPCMEDKKSLPYTDAVLHEIQRFLDIIPLSIPHYALHDISFRGYTIPKVF